MSEIVKKTEINRKAWNQRFSRLERRSLMVTNNALRVNSGDKNENVTIQNHDKVDMISRNVTCNHSSDSVQKPFGKLTAALTALAIFIAIFFLYMEIKKGSENLVR